MEKNILLIDDELSNMRLLIEFLQYHEFRLTVAQTGSEGLYLAKNMLPELILLDIKMPDMDGFAVYRQLLADPKLMHTLVIFLSAVDDIDYKELALNLGGIDYITKPINNRELIVRMRAHLGRQQRYQSVIARLTEYERHIGLGLAVSNANINKIKIISDYLLANLQCTPTLNEIARIANTNRTSINIQFRDVFGMSIFEWLGEQRLLRAATLLRTSAITIQNIADIVGYANASALTHAFKRRFGYTPGEYRLLDTEQITSSII